MKIVILPGAGEPAADPETMLRTAGEAHGFALGNEAGRWLLVDVSAEVAGQLLGGELQLSPGAATSRALPLLLTDARPRHLEGLQTLLCGSPVELYATPAVFEDFTAELPHRPAPPIGCAVHWHLLPVAGDRVVAGFAVDGLPSLEFTALAIAGRVTPAAEGRPPQVGDLLALSVRDRLSGQTLFCTSSASRIGGFELDWMAQADCLLIDGRLAGELPPDPEWFGQIARLPARHKLMLAPDSGCPGARLAEFGIELAYQGMEIAL